MNLNQHRLHKALAHGADDDRFDPLQAQRRREPYLHLSEQVVIRTHLEVEVVSTHCSGQSAVPALCGELEEPEIDALFSMSPDPDLCTMGHADIPDRPGMKHRVARRPKSEAEEKLLAAIWGLND